MARFRVCISTLSGLPSSLAIATGVMVCEIRLINQQSFLTANPFFDFD